MEDLGSELSGDGRQEKPKFAAALLRVADLATLMQLTVWTFSKELAIYNYHDDEFTNYALKELTKVCDDNDIKVSGEEKAINFAKIEANQLRSCIDQLKQKAQQSEDICKLIKYWDGSDEEGNRKSKFEEFSAEKEKVQDISLKSGFWRKLVGTET